MRHNSKKLRVLYIGLQAIMIHYRIRFNKESSSAEKLSFFSRARFEESRRGLLSAALEEKLQPKTIGQRLAFNQKLSRLLEIDSKNAIKQCDIVNIFVANKG